MAYLVNAFSYPLYFLHGSIFGQGNLTYRALTRQALVWRALVWWALVWRALVWWALVWRALVRQALVPRALVLNFKTKIPSRTPILFRFYLYKVCSRVSVQVCLYQISATSISTKNHQWPMNLKVMMMMIMMDVVPHLRSCPREQNHGTRHCEVLVQIQVGGRHAIQ